MSENPPPTETLPGGPPPPRRFLRSSSDRVVAGVAGGLARYFDVDAALVRIVLVVLLFFGGAGALLYLAAVLLVPSEDAVPGGAAAAQTGVPPTQRNAWLVVAGVVLLVAVGLPFVFVAGGLLLPLGFLVLAGLAVAWLATGRRPERDAASLVRATLIGLGILAACAIVAVSAFWVAGLGGDAFVAGAVILAGVAVLAGAFLRPVRWLIPLGIALALPAAFVSAAGIDLDGGVGERTYRPVEAAQLRDTYEIGAGRLVLDLRSADLGTTDRRIDLDVGMGEALVLVPEDVCVAADVEVGMGEVGFFDRGTSGIDVGLEEQAVAKPGNARLTIDADIGLGQLDVRQAGEGDLVRLGDGPVRLDLPAPVRRPFEDQDDFEDRLDDWRDAVDDARDGEWDWGLPARPATGCRGQ